MERMAAVGTATTGEQLFASRRPGFRLGYLPILDGVRGISILAVMAFHAKLPHARGGFLGVDLFFVLSGFLITALLLREWERTGGINFKHFYIRRGLRLLPALFAVLACYLLYASMTGWKDGQLPAYKSAFFTLFYVSNWVKAVMGDNALGMLSHTWSLSIEEQFYLLWPLLLAVMLRVRLSPRVVVLLVGLGALSAAVQRAFLYTGTASIPRVYNGFDTRADALLVGCGVALLVSGNLIPSHRWMRMAIRVAGFAGALLLAVFFVKMSYKSHLLYDYGGLTVIALCAGAILLELLYGPPKFVSRVLGSAVLVWVGQLSYGLYLWQFPVYQVIGKLKLPWMVMTGLRFAVTFAVAALCFYLLERPCLRLKSRFSEA